MIQLVSVLKKNFQKISLLILFIAVFCFQPKAQRSCGSVAPSPEELQRNPALRFFFDSLDAKYRSWMANRPMQRQTAVRVFPVVFHILHNNNFTNISDAQIFSQMEVINNDFQKLNADWPNIPAVWQGLVANCEIKFCLASKDPNGNYSNGIVRKYTDSTNFVLRHTPKLNSTGGSDAWPTDQYINIWVVPGLFNGTTNTLGYATFPWDLAGYGDGVVLRHNVFGTTGTAAAPFDRGRTLTHELGHFFGVKHIWGDDQSSPNQCSGSDGCDDTPNQAVQSFGCPGFPLTDACSNSNPGIMFMNYMDYTDDACMYMFTPNQKSYMDFYIVNFTNRSSILNNTFNACSNCDDNIILSGTSPGGGAFFKARTITSTQIVGSGGALIYKAGQTIRLQTGFRCASGRTLYAGTEPCYPPN
jgi:hypothetical protein